MKYLILLFVALILSCEPNGTIGTVTFYMSPTQGSWTLLVDGSSRGTVDQVISAPDCGEPGFIELVLDVGEHEYDLKSNDGFAWGNPMSFNVDVGCQVIKVRK